LRRFSSVKKFVGFTVRALTKRSAPAALYLDARDLKSTLSFRSLTTGFAKIVGDDFPVFHLLVCHMFDPERDKISKLVKERPCKLKSSK
jgi:hypothetical protein